MNRRRGGKQAMKASRIAVLVVAAGAAGAAFLLASSPKPPPAPVAAQVPGPPPAPVTDNVLVAARDIPLGTVLADADLHWQPWPKTGVAAGMIVEAAEPKALDDARGSIAREPFYGGEPIHREKLIKNANGFMSAILPAGTRAVAINIDTSGANSAGNFILPKDHVDVVRTFQDNENKGPTGAAPWVSETILRNVQVLAIGPNVQIKDGQPVVGGSTATLALDPVQAERVILGQRNGQLSLTLRSILDANGAADATAEPKRDAPGLTVVRFGFAAEGGVQ